MAYDPEVAQRILTIWTRELQAVLARWSQRAYGSTGESGSVTFIQRFGGDLPPNPHFHTIAVDGVYREHDR